MILDRIFGEDKTEDLDTFIVNSEIVSMIGELQQQKEKIEDLKDEADEMEDIDEDEIEVPYGDVVIRHPRDERVVSKALKRLKNEGPKEVSRNEVGEVENPINKIGDPNEILLTFERELTALYDPLFERLKQTEQKVEANFRHLADEELDEENDVFAYLIAEMDNGYIVGGASDIIRNVSRENGFNDVEREFLRLVYNESVRQSSDLGDIKSHLLIDDVIFVFEKSIVNQQKGNIRLESEDENSEEELDEEELDEEELDEEELDEEELDEEELDEEELDEEELDEEELDEEELDEEELDEEDENGEDEDEEGGNSLF